MNSIKQTTEEKNTKRVILLGSTVIVIIVSFITAYLLIDTKISGFKSHMKTFKTTLLEREKATIKAVVDNFINDIEYEESLKIREIEKRVKNQTMIVYELIKIIMENNNNLSKEKTIEIIKNSVKKISKNKNLDFFIFRNDGTLLFANKSTIPEGTNIWDLRDINKELFVKNIIQKNGFIEYLWFAPVINRISKNITYSKNIDDLGITIGNGEFLVTEHSLNEHIIEKINQEKFNKNDFVFIYEIMSLSSSKNYSKLILEKNIHTSDKELTAVETILQTSDYVGNIFYEYDNKLTYSAFLSDERTFISSGVYLNTIEEIIKRETQKSHKNLNKKITSLILSILSISTVFFIFSYFIAEKIGKMFRDYRLRIANSQQLLIQKSKMASMGEMIANIAHQWRQPLAQLSGIFLDVETAHAHKELNEKYLSTRVNQANDLLEYMSKTIDDFKEFYNPNIQGQEFNLLDSIKNAMKIINSSLKFYNIDVHLDVDKSLHVKGLLNEFSQVILNLLSNVKDVSIQREIINPKINIFTKIKNNKVYLHVEDNCGGIDEKIHEKIFEPYFTTKYTYGTGIGLYMCKIIIESKMGGKIFVEKVEKNKCRFTILLPN